MAEETLVKEGLSKEMVELGWELARALRERRVEFSACFWLYSAERNDWQLTLALPFVDTDGPRKAYEVIQTILRPLSANQNRSDRFLRTLRLGDVSVLSPSHRLVRSIQAIPLQDDGVQFKQSRIGDSFVDDVYIYNLSKLA